MRLHRALRPELVTTTRSHCLISEQHLTSAACELDAETNAQLGVREALCSAAASSLRAQGLIRFLSPPLGGCLARREFSVCMGGSHLAFSRSPALSQGPKHHHAAACSAPTTASRFTLLPVHAQPQQTLACMVDHLLCFHPFLASLPHSGPDPGPDARSAYQIQLCRKRDQGEAGERVSSTEWMPRLDLGQAVDSRSQRGSAAVWSMAGADGC